MDVQTFDPSTLFEKHADAEAVKEANAFRTLPTGSYRLTAKKIEYRIAGEQSPWPGAEMVHLQVDAKSSDRSGPLFVDITYQTLRNSEGKLDKPSRLWGQYEKALGVLGKSAGEVVEAIMLYPVDGYVTEAFRTPAGWRTPRTEGERTEYTQGGYETANFVQNVRAAK